MRKVPVMSEPGRQPATAEPSQQFAGFWSSDRSFGLKPGRAVDRDGVRGYYIDFRIKAEAPVWPPPWLAVAHKRLHVATIQWALGCHERWLAGDGDEWLAAAIEAGDDLERTQSREAGTQHGGWLHETAYPHTFALAPPWVSAIAQGEGASLMVRLHGCTGEERFAAAARRALEPLRARSDSGGTRALIDGRPFPEEYPTDPPSFVLNGAVFALWGVRDVARGLADDEAQADLDEGLDMLQASLHRWDLGWWSRYDLHPHPVMNVASSAYHALHVSQLQVMTTLEPRAEFERVLRRFDGYSRSQRSRRRAFARKALFRFAVPRSPLIGRLRRPLGFARPNAPP